MIPVWMLNWNFVEFVGKIHLIAPLKLICSISKKLGYILSNVIDCLGLVIRTLACNYSVKSLFLPKLLWSAWYHVVNILVYYLARKSRCKIKIVFLDHWNWVTNLIFTSVSLISSSKCIYWFTLKMQMQIENSHSW